MALSFSNKHGTHSVLTGEWRTSVERCVLHVPHSLTAVQKDYVIHEHKKKWVGMKERDGWRLESAVSHVLVPGVQLVEEMGAFCHLVTLEAAWSRRAQVVELDVSDTVAMRLIAQNPNRFKLTG